MKDQLNITDIVDMLIRRWWIWVISAIIAGIVAFTYTEIFIDPLYKTDGTLYVNAQRTQSSDISSGSIASSQKLATTYREVLRRRSFMSVIAEDLGNKYSVAALQGMVTYSTVNNTEILMVRVTGKVPEDVYAICHSILIHASDELVRVINAGSVKMLDDGQVPSSPISPNVKKNTMIAFLIGMAIGAVIILLLELFDTRIKSRDDIINKYDEPLLGEIPEVLPYKKAGAAK